MSNNNNINNNHQQQVNNNQNAGNGNPLPYTEIIEGQIYTAFDSVSNTMISCSITFLIYMYKSSIPYMIGGFIGCLLYDLYARWALYVNNNGRSQNEIEVIKARWKRLTRYAYYFDAGGVFIGYIPLLLNYYGVKLYAYFLEDVETGSRRGAGLVTGFGYMVYGYLTYRSIEFALCLFFVGFIFGIINWGTVEKTRNRQLAQDEINERLVADFKWALLIAVVARFAPNVTNPLREFKTMTSLEF